MIKERNAWNEEVQILTQRKEDLNRELVKFRLQAQIPKPQFSIPQFSIGVPENIPTEFSTNLPTEPDNVIAEPQKQDRRPIPRRRKPTPSSKAWNKRRADGFAILQKLKQQTEEARKLKQQTEEANGEDRRKRQHKDLPEGTINFILPGLDGNQIEAVPASEVEGRAEVYYRIEGRSIYDSMDRELHPVSCLEDVTVDGTQTIIVRARQEGEDLSKVAIKRPRSGPDT